MLRGVLACTGKPLLDVVTQVQPSVWSRSGPSLARFLPLSSSEGPAFSALPALLWFPLWFRFGYVLTPRKVWFARLPTPPDALK